MSVSPQPHVRKKLSAKKLFPFPWDNESRGNKSESVKVIDKDIAKSRFERLLQARS